MRAATAAVVAPGGAPDPALLMREQHRVHGFAWVAASIAAHVVEDRLSPRETEVLRYLCRGLANKEIARELDLQEVTVKLHVKTLYRKIEARNRTHAAMIAKEAGLF